MTTIKLSEEYPVVVTFDGNVLEIFHEPYQQEYRRHGLHIFWIDSIELIADKWRNQSMVVHTTEHHDYAKWPVDENIVPKVTDLIAEIKRAKASFHFD